MESLVPAGIGQLQLSTPSGIASPYPRTHLSWGSPYLMTNQGKSVNTQPYWPKREWLWGASTAAELPRGQKGCWLRLWTYHSTVSSTQPYLSNSISASVSEKWNLWQYSKLICMKRPIFSKCLIKTQVWFPYFTFLISPFQSWSNLKWLFFTRL